MRRFETEHGDPKLWTGVYLEDRGRFWRVVEWHGPQVYGGGVSFLMDKCDGRITNVKIGWE
jgi:hypothetical protein